MSGPVLPIPDLRVKVWNYFKNLPLCMAPSQDRGVMFEKLPADR
jgi:hypothetical protein